MRNISCGIGRALLLMVLCIAGSGCRDSLDVVLPERLAEGDGGMAVSSLPQLDIVVRMASDSTGFNVFDLMQMIVNGENRVFDETMVVGGDWAVYTVPAPGNDTFSVILNRRIGTFVDDFDWVTVPYTGPTISGVAPDTAEVGTQVTISGTGFDGGALRVYFGGIEGTVDSSTPTSITATVPDDALPGLVFVLIGSAAADGIVGFQPRDEGTDVPAPTTVHISQIYPGSGPTESVIRVYGYNFTTTAFSRYDGSSASRILNVRTIDVSPIGSMRMAFAIPFGSTKSGDIDFTLDEAGTNSNQLPYTIE